MSSRVHRYARSMVSRRRFAHVVVAALLSGGLFVTHASAGHPFKTGMYANAPGDLARIPAGGAGPGRLGLDRGERRRRGWAEPFVAGSCSDDRANRLGPLRSGGFKLQLDSLR